MNSTYRNPVLDRWPEDDQDTTTISWRSPWICVLRLWRNWTFSYMNVVLDRGAKQKESDAFFLTSNDLYVVPQSMESSHLVRDFRQHHHPSSAQHVSHGDDASTLTSTDTSSATSQRLIYTLWKLALPTFVPAGFCELLVVICGTSLPLLVINLLAILEDHPNQKVVSEGMPVAAAIFIVSIVNGLGNHRHRHLALKTGVALRAAVVNIIYEHVLKLSPQGKQGLTSGEVTNLVAVDTQKIFEVTQDGHLMWALPLHVMLISFFLYKTLGPSTLVGIVVLVGSVPVIQLVSERMLDARHCRVAYADQRVEVVSNMLQGIKTTKLNNYESKYHTRLTETRNHELRHLTNEMAIWALVLAMIVISPVLATAATLVTYVLIDENNVLTTADTFGVLLLFNALRYPINFTGRLIGKAAQALSAIKRISEFLERPLREDTANPKSRGDTCVPSTRAQLTGDEVENLAPLKLSRAAFRIGDALSESGSSSVKDSQGGFTVSEFNFSIDRGQVLAVCGPVGSGKSTLLNGILEEAEALGETIILRRGQTSYVPQSPFILNRTIRENILFGLPLDDDRYARVIDACCLREDLKQLGDAGDETEIGERGATLSGGQKQRISLARAAYADSSLYVLDDPFSALDSGTGKMVFERLIAAPDALLSDAAIIFVTHASHFVTSRAVDMILLLVGGENRFLGSWEELVSFNPHDEHTQRAVEHIKASLREEEEDSDSEDEESDEKVMGTSKPKNRKGTRLVRAEEREHGVSSLKTWLLWFQRAGGVKFASLLFLALILDRCLYVAVEWFLARWTSAAEESIELLGIDFPSQANGRTAQSQYLKVYASLTLLSCIATLVRSEWVVTGGTRATRTVFANMLSSVLRAPVSYFETVPMGRILNRFTYDTDITDVTLTQNISVFMISTSWYVASVIIQGTILPWSLLSVSVITALYWRLMLHYRMSGPDLQRIDAVSRSPLQSMVSECLEGSTSIRVFHQGWNFVERFQDVADLNSCALLNFVTAQRWLGIRMELLASAVVLTIVVLVVCMNDTLHLEPGIVGLLIVWSVYFTVILNFMVDAFSETEAAITAIERVDDMASLPSEKAMETDEASAPPKNWPERGLVKFDKVCMRYREGLPLALNEMSFELPAGKTCGIVGRTGAGKSSITVALFRLVEIESGQICLDGIDLGTLGLSDVRGRGMSIIPQDPFLSGATLRECLDPFDHHSDEDIVEALRSVRLESNDDVSFLSTKVEEGGSNYSVGERQLLNLARASLSQPKLLVLDEATASIDGETDAFIQTMLRTRFPNTTLITIAHRLNTIMDNDFVLVMDAGSVVEFGSPAEVLEISGGVFSELVDATGIESSKALREMARRAHLARSSDTSSP